MERGAMLLIMLTFGAVLAVVRAAEPELVTDFFNDAKAADLDAEYFTFRNLTTATAAPGPFATVINANVPNGFKALNSLSVSNALLLFPPGTVNRPHIHPRGTETLFVLEGSLEVGLLSPDNTLFTTTIKQGEIFVFPRAFVHFQINREHKVLTKAYASFSSQNAGLITLPVNLFGSYPLIDTDILAKSFQVSPKIILAVEAGVASA